MISRRVREVTPVAHTNTSDTKKIMNSFKILFFDFLTNLYYLKQDWTLQLQIREFHFSVINCTSRTKKQLSKKPDLANWFWLKELIIWIFYMTRDLTDQKGWVSSKAIRRYRYSLPYLCNFLLFHDTSLIKWNIISMWILHKK